MTTFNCNGRELYLDNAVTNVLDRKIIELKDDGDIVAAVTAGEGYGKSTFAQTLGGYFATKLKTKFSVDNIHFDTDSFIDFAENSPKYTVVILDESRSDLYRGSSNSNKNKRFTHWLSECRSKNLILIFLIPSIHDFDPYINKWRLSLWFEVTKRKDKNGIYKRGYYNVLGLKKRKVFLKFLTIKYAKTPNTLVVLRGTFGKETPIDKVEYEKKKDTQRNIKFLDKKKELQQITLTPRQIEVLTKIKPSKVFESRSSDYEILQKLVNSLKKEAFSEIG